MASKKKFPSKKSSSKSARPAAKGKAGAKKMAGKMAGKTAGKKPGAKKSSASRPAAKRSASGSKRSTKRPTLRTKRPVSRPRAAKVRKPATPKAVSLPINDEGLKLAKSIATIANDKKAIDPTIIDVRAKGAQVGYDYVVVASGESDRQLSAIADAVTEEAKKLGRRHTSIESSPEWVLVDYGDVVAHFFTTDRRSLTDLEGQWSDAPRVEVPA